VSKVPSYSKEGSIYLIAGPRDFYRAEVDGTGPLAGGWAYRAVAAGQIAKTFTGLASDRRALALSLTRRFKSGGFLARYGYLSQEQGTGAVWFADKDGNLSTFLPRDKPITDEKDAMRDRRTHSFDVEGHHRFGFQAATFEHRLALRVVDAGGLNRNYSAGLASYRFFDANNVLLGNATNLSMLDPRISYIAVNRALQEQTGKEEAWAVNYDITSSFSTGKLNHKALFYATSIVDDISQNRYVSTYAPLNLTNRVYQSDPPAGVTGPRRLTIDRDNNRYAYALAAQDVVSTFDDRLIFVAGVRYDYQITDIKDYVNPASSISNDTRTGWTSKLATLYRPWESLSIFYNYSEGFQPSGFGIEGEKLPNRETTNNEIGAKISLPGNKLTMQISGFDVVTKQVAISMPFTDPETGASRSRSVPSGRQQIRGWEADFSAIPVRNVMVFGGIGKVNSKTEANLRPRGVPLDLNWRVFVRYTFNAENWLRNVWVGAGWEHTSERVTDTADPGMLPEIDLINVALGWKYKQLKLNLNVENVFDVEKARSATGANGIYVSEPPGVRLSAKWEF
jgi:outer membrane receptor protein involved in Fe transport